MIKESISKSNSENLISECIRKIETITNFNEIRKSMLD